MEHVRWVLLAERVRTRMADVSAWLVLLARASRLETKLSGAGKFRAAPDATVVYPGRDVYLAHIHQ